MLTNAIYFKSTWAEPFTQDATREEQFHLAGGGSVAVPLMHQWMDIEYMETDEFQLVDLPYAGGVLSMTVLLPRQADGLERLEKRLSAQDLAGWLAKAQFTEVDLSLPRFSFTSAFELKKVLAALGMTDAFDGAKADFSGMSPEKMAISKVLHQAFVAVDERGTEAAAATAVIMQRAAAPEQPPVVFRADRPFLFLIRHRPTGAILFLGRVANPAPDQATAPTVPQSGPGGSS